MSTQMTLKPRLSEKAYASSNELNTYVFDVPATANKVTVADAVAVQFNVTVEAVNIAIRKGKAKRTYRRGGRPTTGYDKTVKKAYVRIKAGQQIPVFAAIEEEEKQAEKTAKLVEKATEKKAKKDAKEAKKGAK